MEALDYELIRLNINKYNELVKNWHDGIKWMSNPKLTDEQLKKGEERMSLRLSQLNEVYNELIQSGVQVTPEEYIKL